MGLMGSGVKGLRQKEDLEAVGEPGLELAGCPAVVGDQPGPSLYAGFRTLPWMASASSIVAAERSDAVGSA